MHVPSFDPVELELVFEILDETHDSVFLDQDFFGRAMEEHCCEMFPKSNNEYGIESISGVGKV